MAKLIGNKAAQLELLKIVKRANLDNPTDRKMVVRAVEKYPDWKDGLMCPSFHPNGEHIIEIHLVCKGRRAMASAKSGGRVGGKSYPSGYDRNKGPQPKDYTKEVMEELVKYAKSEQRELT
jgi:hypothetical protein